MMPEFEDIPRWDFARRIESFERSASWMLDEDLLRLLRTAAGRPDQGRDACLDVCCGTGIVGRELLSAGWKVRGLDHTPEMGWVASKYFTVKIGAAERMAVDERSLDLVVMRESLLLLDLEQALAEIRRVLKVGGRFVVAQSVAFSNEDEARHREVQRAIMPATAGYLTGPQLEVLLARHGFNVSHADRITVRESVDHWLAGLPELTPERRAHVRRLILDAPEGYRRERDVTLSSDGELFEDWSWLVLSAERRD